MAQRMIDLRKIKKNISTQTEDSPEFFVYLTKTKKLHLYFSEAYKDFVLCLTFSNCKNYIITRHMWKKLRNYIRQIDNELNK